MTSSTCRGSSLDPIRRAAARARFGASACSDRRHAVVARARSSRRGRARATRATCCAIRSGPITSRRAGAGSQPCGKPSVSTKPGLTVCTRIPRAAELRRGRAREGELRVLRCRVGAGRGNRDRARDRDDVDDVGRRSRLERGQERPQAPDAAEIVRRASPPRSARRRPRGSRARRDARVVDEQVNAGP